MRSSHNSNLSNEERDSELLYLGELSILLIYGTNLGVELGQCIGIYFLQLFFIGKSENE
jgi:hypothetical protein